MRSLLIVDDQPGIRLLLKDVLTNEGYKISLAETGLEALEKIYEHTFDLVILDYRLPILDGGAVVKKLEELNIRVPIIMMTGLIESMEDVVTNHEMVIDVIAKPFNLQDICERIKITFA